MLSLPATHSLASRTRRVLSSDHGCVGHVTDWRMWESLQPR